MKRLIKITRISVLVLLTLIILILGSFTFATAIRESQNAKVSAPKSGRFISTDNGELFIQELGSEDGIPIIFIHGSLAWSETWKEVMVPLSEKGFRTIAVDLPPFGFSRRPDNPSYSTKDQAQRILDLTDKLNIKPILVGHSFGGSPTIEAAMMAPEKFSGLVLIDAAVDPEPVPYEAPNPWLKALLGQNILRNSLISTTFTNPMLTRYFLQQFIYKKETANDKIVSIYQEPLNIKGSTNALGNWLPFLIFPQTGLLNQSNDSYQKLTMPVLIIWGEKDSITPLSLGEELNKLIPGSRMVVLREVGHIPQIENVKQLNQGLEIGLKKLNLLK